MEKTSGRYPTCPEKQDLIIARSTSSRAAHRIDNQSGAFVHELPVNRSMVNERDNDVGLVDECCQVPAHQVIAFGSRESRNVWIVIRDFGLASLQQGDDLGCRRVSQVVDIGFERRPDHADKRAIQR